MPKLILMRGLPGSGKTTKAMEFVAQGFMRINYDDIRKMIFGENFDYNIVFATRGIEYTIKKMCETLAKSFASYEYDIVIDNINLAQSTIKFWEAFAKYQEYEFEIFEMDTSIEICIERDAARSRSVGEKVIRDLYKAHYGN